MRRLLFLLIIILVTSACSDDDGIKSSAEQEDVVEGEDESQTDSQNEEDSQKKSNQGKTTENPDSKNDNKENAKKDSTIIQEDFRNYRPEVGDKKTFIQNDQYEITHNIIAGNDRLLQRVIEFGDVETLQILEWSSDQLSVVFQEENPKSISDQLDTFETYESPKTLININKSGNGEGESWEVIADKETVEVPYGNFENVFVVKRTKISESSSNKNVYKAFYAPNVGLIKETYEVIGDNGYKVVTNLESMTTN